eukprot:1318334-Rhodomonas_salina.2
MESGKLVAAYARSVPQHARRRLADSEPLSTGHRIARAGWRYRVRRLSGRLMLRRRTLPGLVGGVRAPNERDQIRQGLQVAVCVVVDEAAPDGVVPLLVVRDELKRRGLDRPARERDDEARDHDDDVAEDCEHSPREGARRPVEQQQQQHLRQAEGCLQRHPPPLARLPRTRCELLVPECRASESRRDADRGSGNGVGDGGDGVGDSGVGVGDSGGAVPRPRRRSRGSAARGPARLSTAW